MKRVLVTGGAGFIGSHLAPALQAKGYRVRIFDNLSPQVHGDTDQPPDWIGRSGAEFIRGSITAPGDVAAAVKDIDTVVHLAAETGTAQSMYEIARYNEVNSQGTALLLDTIARQKDRVKKILLASSRSVYGEGAYRCEKCSTGGRLYPESRSAENLAARIWEHLCPSCRNPLPAVPTREDDRLMPASIYAATKSAQEDLVRITCAALGIGYAILRLQNVYGEGQSLNNPYTGILSIFSTRIRQGLPIPVFEDGCESRDFVHAEDVANAFIAALEHGEDLVVNVGSGRQLAVQDLAAALCNAFKAEPDIRITGQYRLGDIRHNFADITVLREALGYEPRIRIDQGLARFVAWVKKQPLADDGLDAANQELISRNLMR